MARVMTDSTDRIVKIPAFDTEACEELYLPLEKEQHYRVITLECELRPVHMPVQGGYNAVLIKDDQVYLVQNIDFDF